MLPIIYKFGPFAIYSYGLMLAIAVVVCSWLLARDAQQKLGTKSDVIYDLVFWTVVGGLLGARLFFILLNLPMYLNDPLEIVRIQNGGLCWQGGLAGGAAAGLWFVRRQGLPVLKMLDLAAPYLALGQAIGRVGCFFNGCCYGKPWPHGIYFPVHDAVLHPTQLYESVGLLIVFLILRHFQKISKISGEVFVAYLLFASILRFLNEFFRADHAETFFGLSIFQMACLVIIAVAIFIHSRLNRRSRS